MITKKNHNMISLSTVLLLTLTTLFIATQPARAQTASSEPVAPHMQQWLGEIMNNIDFSLFMRIQQAAVDNMSLITPYSQEYYQCLKAEGALEEKAGTTSTPSLDELINSIKTKGKNCHPIVQELFSQMEFDISEQEFEQGLSPEYLKKYQDLKSSI